MINVTSTYPGQIFLSVASSQIISQINGINASSIKTLGFPRIYSRTSFAGVSPDGSLAKMYQFDAQVNNQYEYSYPTLGWAQNQVLQAAAAVGNEYYIELSPLPSQYYQILTWASNL